MKKIIFSFFVLSAVFLVVSSTQARWRLGDRSYLRGGGGNREGEDPCSSGSEVGVLGRIFKPSLFGGFGATRSTYPGYPPKNPGRCISGRLVCNETASGRVCAPQVCAPFPTLIDPNLRGNPPPGLLDPRR